MTENAQKIADLTTQARARREEREARERAEQERQVAAMVARERNNLINAFPDIVALFGDDDQHFVVRGLRIDYRFVLDGAMWLISNDFQCASFGVQYPDGGKQYLNNYHQSYQEHLLGVIEEYQANHAATEDAPPSEADTPAEWTEEPDMRGLLKTAFHVLTALKRHEEGDLLLAWEMNSILIQAKDIIARSEAAFRYLDANSL